MSIKMEVLKDKEEWKKNRGKYIGGSDVACVVGLNPYKTSQELWLEKTGRKQSPDLKGNKLVEYGTNAEEYLRNLFALDYPQMTVFYQDNNSWSNTDYPFGRASLDGWMKDENGRLGILEIKTCTIKSKTQKESWNERIPDNYFCQVLFYMAMVDADFVIVKAQLKYEYEGSEPYCVTKHYRIERADHEEDIAELMEKAKEFHKYIETDTEPPVVLNI